MKRTKCYVKIHSPKENRRQTCPNVIHGFMLGATGIFSIMEIFLSRLLRVSLC